ncbi:MAG: ribonuclease D [Nakamurella sp.]
MSTPASDGGAADAHENTATESAATELTAEPTLTPLLRPRDGTPAPITDHLALRAFADALSSAQGPIALDTERASGFRYGGRAFLVQIRRAGAGTALVDPVPFNDLEPLAEPMKQGEWILHAATQDLPCLAELGLRPTKLFDTELAGRLAGLPRVGLGPLVEQILGLHLAKGHGADDWSRRPIPADLLDYAALDVEVLIELRDAMAELLARDGKLEWAEQEFAAIVDAPPPPAREDPWRRTSGIHAIVDRRTLAAIRELWLAREALAQSRDLAPHRVLPDTAIVAAATAMPDSATALTGLPVFRGPAQRRQASRWFAALDRARRIPVADLPPRQLPADGPPAPSRWAHKDPDAAARLDAARIGLSELSEKVAVPVENLAAPRLVRAILWKPPTTADVPQAMTDGGARLWQIELVAPVLEAALDALS